MIRTLQEVVRVVRRAREELAADACPPDGEDRDELLHDLDEVIAALVPFVHYRSEGE